MSSSTPFSASVSTSTPGASIANRGVGLVLVVLAMVAVTAPALLAFSIPPSVTFFNQAAALAGWGLFSLAICGCWWASTGVALTWRCLPALGALALLAGSVVLAYLAFGLPKPLALSSLGFIGAAALVLAMGTLTGGLPAGRLIFAAFCVALVVAGLGSLVVAIVQYFFPAAADGEWIARLATPGRAGGNLRQPNHLSSLLLLSIAALVWLHEEAELRLTGTLRDAARGLSAVVLMGFVFGVVLTVSRTGTVCILLLAGWGVFDKRMSRFSRWMLWALPVAYLLFWMGMYFWAASSAHAFAGADQLQKADPSSSRFGIWANAWALVKQHPLTGVGWGEFNFAWSLTPFPGRPGAFFDHTHNLPLQLLVELGIPLGLAVLGLVGWAVWLAGEACAKGEAKQLAAARTAFMMVLMMGVHSQLEYPLWYAYFLLPTAFAFGVGLGTLPEKTGKTVARRRGGQLGPVSMMAVSGVLVLGTVFSLLDYSRVVLIFMPGGDPAPLERRIALGRGSVFFAHHGDYAAATVVQHPSTMMDAFDRAPHYLLDTRLMMAWSKALMERGESDKARYVAERLKEFKNPQSAEFFAECDRAVADNAALPYQCTPPSRAFTYEDFRPAAP